MTHLNTDANALLAYLDSNILKDYDVFVDVAGNYYGDAAKISQMMLQFADHASKLKDSFANMDGKSLRFPQRWMVMRMRLQILQKTRTEWLEHYIRLRRKLPHVMRYLFS